MLKSDGDHEACGVASAGDVQPPDGCAALLRVEVVPIDRMFAPTPVDAAPPPPPDPTLERKLENAQRMTRVSIAAVVGLCALISGAAVHVTYRRRLAAESSHDTVSSAREQNIAGARTGIGLMAGGGALVVLGLTLGIVGSRRMKKLERTRAAVQPTIGPGGIGVMGRFSP